MVENITEETQKVQKKRRSKKGKDPVATFKRAKSTIESSFEMIKDKLTFKDLKEYSEFLQKQMQVVKEAKKSHAADEIANLKAKKEDLDEEIKDLQDLLDQ